MQIAMLILVSAFAIAMLIGLYAAALDWDWRYGFATFLAWFFGLAFWGLLVYVLIHLVANF